MCPEDPPKWYSDMPYTGDFWVDFGEGNRDKWEDEHGNLHALGASVGTRGHTRGSRGSIARGAAPNTSPVFDLVGKRVEATSPAWGLLVQREGNGSRNLIVRAREEVRR